MKIILGITGSVASTLTVKLCRALIDAGHKVRIVATKPALYFITDEQKMLTPERDLSLRVYTDDYEWPNIGYKKDDDVEHIEFRSWADALLIAPLSANTLAKISYGMCDNFLTCIARAWQKDKQFLIAPAMNTQMWIDPITAEQISNLKKRYTNMTLINPISKVLACGDDGVGAMARIETIVEEINKFKS